MHSMSDPPAGSLRDTAALARQYSATSHWQRARGLALLDLAAPADGETALDLGCGTGELSVELARRAGPSGRVVAIDPNPARLRQAEAGRPPELDHLVFRQASATALDGVADGSIDLVFSNYAVHWILDQPAMLDEVRRVLRPGGRFVAEFLRAYTELFVELVRLMPDGDSHLGENRFLSEAEWRDMIAARRFETVALECPDFALEYDDLPALLDWLEATSHGAFDAAKIPSQTRAAYDERFPGRISLVCQAYRLVLRRKD